MNISNNNIDCGKAFDWGRVSKDYAKYRDIYPKQFYDKIVDRNLCIKGQNILDLGTGTGVLPRNMYQYGGKWTGIDISKEQIEQARLLSAGMDIEYLSIPTENIDFPTETFDIVTACQCFWYFNHKQVMPIIYNILKKSGKLLILYMAWLPYEDKIAAESEKIVLKYSPNWSGAGEIMHPIDIPKEYNLDFEIVYHEEYPLKVHFTRETWNGRMKACRGVGASLTKKEICSWEQEHKKMLLEIAPSDFDILHYAAIAELRVKK
ncbi:MAG: class I SAM-dependent methyltransferase [Ruminococcaceae bacterium]|nr:class I SAM-dependent methyltransferase [Oscillospiraceae bacterium]